MESRAEVVGKDLEEINGWFDRHRGEINHLKIREKDAKEETERLKGFIVGAGHEAQVFKNHLDRTEFAGVGGLLQRLERSSSLLRMKGGRNCPTPWSGRMSMLLLRWRTQFLCQFLLQLLVFRVPTLLFQL